MGNFSLYRNANYDYGNISKNSGDMVVTTSNYVVYDGITITPTKLKNLLLGIETLEISNNTELISDIKFSYSLDDVAEPIIKTGLNTLDNYTSIDLINAFIKKLESDDDYKNNKYTDDIIYQIFVLDNISMITIMYLYIISKISLDDIYRMNITTSYSLNEYLLFLVDRLLLEISDLSVFKYCIEGTNVKPNNLFNSSYVKTDMRVHNAKLATRTAYTLDYDDMVAIYDRSVSNYSLYGNILLDKNENNYSLHTSYMIYYKATETKSKQVPIYTNITYKIPRVVTTFKTTLVQEILFPSTLLNRNNMFLAIGSFGLFSKIHNKIKNTVKAVAGTVANVTQKAVASIQSNPIVQAVTSTAKNIIKPIVETIKTVTKPIVQAVENIIYEEKVERILLKTVTEYYSVIVDRQKSLTIKTPVDINLAYGKQSIIDYYPQMIYGYTSGNISSKLLLNVIRSMFKNSLDNRILRTSRDFNSPETNILTGGTYAKSYKNVEINKSKYDTSATTTSSDIYTLANIDPSNSDKRHPEILSLFDMVVDKLDTDLISNINCDNVEYHPLGLKDMIFDMINGFGIKYQNKYSNKRTSYANSSIQLDDTTSKTLYFTNMYDSINSNMYIPIETAIEHSNYLAHNRLINYSVIDNNTEINDNTVLTVKQNNKRYYYHTLVKIIFDKINALFNKNTILGTDLYDLKRLFMYTSKSIRIPRAIIDNTSNIQYSENYDIFSKYLNDISDNKNTTYSNMINAMNDSNDFTIINCITADTYYINSINVTDLAINYNGEMLTLCDAVKKYIAVDFDINNPRSTILNQVGPYQLTTDAEKIYTYEHVLRLLNTIASDFVSRSNINIAEAINTLVFCHTLESYYLWLIDDNIELNVDGKFNPAFKGLSLPEVLQDNFTSLNYSNTDINMITTVYSYIARYVLTISNIQRSYDSMLKSNIFNTNFNNINSGVYLKLGSLYDMYYKTKIINFYSTYFLRKLK